MFNLQWQCIFPRGAGNIPLTRTSSGYSSFSPCLFAVLDKQSRQGTSLSFVLFSGFSKDIQFHVCLQISRADIRPHVKWFVNLVIADGQFNLPYGFVWVCMG